MGWVNRPRLQLFLKTAVKTKATLSSEVNKPALGLVYKNKLLLKDFIEC